MRQGYVLAIILTSLYAPEGLYVKVRGVRRVRIAASSPGTPGGDVAASAATSPPPAAPASAAPAVERRALEREEGRRPVPIVARTGNSASDYGEACIAAGMNGFLTKPVGLDALDATLRSLGRMPAGPT